MPVRSSKPSWLRIFIERLDDLKVTSLLGHRKVEIAAHLLALVAAVLICVLNLSGNYVGKELQGKINQDGTKMLALQLTAKVHELLMLASLGKILWRFLLHLVLSGQGAPLSALSVGDKFSGISYLWSAEFISTCVASFARKFPFLAVTVICTILGSVLGPASATAMAPSIDEYSVSQVKLPLSLSPDQLWPSRLDLSSVTKNECAGTSCGVTASWTTLGISCFAYWGQETPGALKGMPEITSIPGGQSLRQLRYRFRGPFSLYQPRYTTATVQPVWAANEANNLRFLWSKDNGRRCSTGRSHYCSFQDMKFSVQAPQPVAAVSCTSLAVDGPISFPTLVRNDTAAHTVSTTMQRSSLDVTNDSSLSWVTLNGSAFGLTSVGVIVQIRDSASNRSFSSFACSVDAQWSNTTISTTFLGSPFLVDGSPPFFFEPDREGSTYSGSRVSIDPVWAASINRVANNATNETVFDSLYTAGKAPGSLEEASSKVEAILSVLVVESMAWIGAEASIKLDSIRIDQSSVTWEEISRLHVQTAAASFIFRTTVIGYGFGVQTANYFSTGRFLSVFTLLAYSVVVAAYLIYMVAFSENDKDVEDSTLNLLVIALKSPSADSQVLHAGGSKLLQRNVKIVCANNRPKMIIDTGNDRNQIYHKLDPSDDIED